MKGFLVRVIVLWCGLVAIRPLGAENPPSQASTVILRAVSPGLDNLNDSTGGTTLQEVWKQPASIALRSEALDKLARAIASRLRSADADTEKRHRDLIRPLLDDLLQKQTYLEITDTWHWILAIKLDAQKQRLWNENCTAIVQNLASANDQPRAFSVEAVNSWLILTGPTGTTPKDPRSTAERTITDRIRREGNPGPEDSGTSFSIEADLSKLKSRFPKLISSKLARLTAKVHGRESNLRTEMTVRLSEPADWQLEAWNIPLQTIRDSRNSLMSFTAVQGIRPWLNHNAFAGQLGMSPLPNQLFLWGQSYAPYQIQTAFPVGDGSREIENLASNRLPEWNKTLAKNSVGSLEKLADGTGLLWRSLPILTPYLRISREPDQDYLLGGVFPVPPSTNPPPAALIKQLTDRNNLLYYDWEITQTRLAQLRSMVPLLSIVTTLASFSPTSLAGKWLDTIEPKLGNTVTEISVSSPDTLSFVRTSHLGLNGLELVGLALWLDSSDFPKANMSIGFRPVPIPSR